MSTKNHKWYFGPGEAEYMRAHRGQPVAVVLLTGETLEGTLVGVDPYHLIVRRRDGFLVLVYKHSIVYALGRQPLTTPEPGEGQA